MNTRNVIIGGALSALSIAGIIILRSLPWTKKHVKKQSKNKPTTVKGWGSNSSGQMSLGYAGNGPDYVLKIGQFSNLTNIKYISSGPYHTLVLLENGTLLGCGSNSFGKLCRNADVNAVYTIRVMDMLTSVVDVAAGPSFNIAVTKDGKVWSWGSNNKGQLGIGSDDYDLVVETPTEVTALRNQKITKVYAGGSDQYNKGGFAFALTGMYFTIFVTRVESGDVWGWGSNFSYCLGLGKSSPDRSFPVKIPSLRNVSNLAIGITHAMSLSATGQVKTWGKNPLGLGYHCQNDQDVGVPNPVYGLRNIKIVQISASGDISNDQSAVSFALTATGQVYAWGTGDHVGIGATADVSTPYLINFSGRIIANIFSASLRGFALTEGGTLLGWGSTGLARTGKSKVPVDISEFKGTEVLNVFAAHDNVFVLSQ